ncbi:hypothetical protein HHK36_003150 [Tetracentron sinense]|uniref:Uncharacterized protein n=1 Tax=Tetracentron sinense TaxID=13715 RepID=A0A834ZSS7_TETSI|nr:hypothetical protein HHK36_003150 [Tetracentron sinense]
MQFLAMGFDASCGIKMQEVKWHGHSLKPSKSMEVTSRHKRSKSDPDKRRVKEAILDSFETPHHLKLALCKCLILDLILYKDMGRLRECVDTKKKQSPNTKVQNSLKREIIQLEKRLQDQFVERRALEKALGYRSSSHDISKENSMPKPAKELIKEIAVLELEVVYLEQHLLSLYRKAFDQQISFLSPSTIDERLKSPSDTQKGMFVEVSGLDIPIKREISAVQFNHLNLPGDSLANPWKESNATASADKLLYSSIHRSHSSLSQRSACSTRTSPPMEALAKAVRACHSQPLSMLEHAQSATTNVISLAEHLGTRISDHVPETPNRISEDMIKCMSAIYCKLADPPLMHHGLSSSPISPLSSMSAFSPQDQSDVWSPRCRKDSSFDARLDNPFHVEGLKEFSGPYSTMVEVPWICRDSQKLSEIEHMVQNFRLLVCRLEDVDPRRMKHEEKLAFWINIHNALVMHVTIILLEDINLMMLSSFYGSACAMNRDDNPSVLSCSTGIFGLWDSAKYYEKSVFTPKGEQHITDFFSRKKCCMDSFFTSSCVIQAAYNVAGHTISVDTIESSILGCRMPRPGQWLRFLFSQRTKFKYGDDRQAYAIERPEPLLHFALCSGGHSDPAVRICTPKRVFQELEAAKEEYIRATFGVRNEQKILLPKIVESFAKDSGLCPLGVVEMIQQCMPETLRKSIQRCQQGKSRKSIEWIPHNFGFRYLISKELVK